MRRLLLLMALLLSASTLRAGTLAIFETSVGNMELELFDQDKPVTVQNFINYVRSGRFQNMFVQRWEPRFVIQGGGYYVESTETNLDVRLVKTFGMITNEYSVGRTFSNTYGTIAMARQSGRTNSATSQWFLNLTNNAFLDTVDGGFTVFGKIISGTNVLNLFYPPPPTHGIHRTGLFYTNQYNEVIFMDTLPVRSANPTFGDLVYVNVKVIELGLGFNLDRSRTIVWNSVTNTPHALETSTDGGRTWQVLTTAPGTGEAMSYQDTSPPAASQLYRVRIDK